MSIAAGDHLGPYEILSRIGAGGMGEVWRARDSRLDRSVAIKILPTAYAGDARVRLRFEREAKAISQLNHPHICTLHDLGNDHGIDYLVMELVDGESMAERLMRGALPLAEVVRYGAQIAEALERAHRTGIIHRDLKPANVMLTRSGVKLLDFGLAKGAAIEISDDGITEQIPLTTEGMIVGTFQYMAPEQLEGLPSDARTDLWSLGTVLYEMATGRRAFNGTSKTSLIAAIVSSEPLPITDFQPLTPPALEHVIARCLAKNPDDRWQSAHDVAEELRWISEAGSRAGSPALKARRTSSTERWIWIAALLATLGAATWLALRPRPRSEPMTVAIMPEGNEGLNYWSGPPALSPDGKLLAYASVDPNGRRMLWIRSMERGTMQPVTGTDDAFAPFWSPDSAFVAFLDTNAKQLKKVAVASGDVEILANGTNGGWSWNRDGVILFGSVNPASIQRVAAAGGETTMVLKPSEIGAEVLSWPRFLPDGNHFVFLAVGDILTRHQQAGLWVATLDRREPPRFLTAAVSNGMYVAPGFLLYVRGGVLQAQAFDAKRLRFTGSAVPVAPVQTFNWPGLFGLFGVFTATDSGLLLYQPPRSAPQTQLLLKNRKGDVLQNVGAPSFHWAPRVSPDGRSVAYDRSDERGLGDIWIDNVATGVATRASFEAVNETAPVWSPRGDELAYAMARAAPLDGSSLVRKPLGGAPSALFFDPAGMMPTDWSPDGRAIVFTRFPGSGGDVEVWSISDAKRIDVARTAADEANGVFSPDGKWLAYQSNESGRFEIYAQPYPPTGAKEQLSMNGGVTPRWLRNGDVAWVDPTGRVELVHVTTTPALHVGAPELLFSIEQRRPVDSQFDVTPDGNFLVNAFVHDQARPMTLLLNWQRRFEAR